MLGAYSQYGWFHPGPLLFYLLAPFYTVGGRTVYGLDLGAFVINVLSLVIIASIVGRRRSLSPVTAVSLLAGLSAYLARLPDLLTSAWNPHISVWPFAALIAGTAATADGTIAWLPAVAVLASFVVQTHVGFAPVALALGFIASAGNVRVVLFDRERRLRSVAWMLFSMVVVQMVWLPVLADEITGDPGNLTKICADRRLPALLAVGPWRI